MLIVYSDRKFNKNEYLFTNKKNNIEEWDTKS